MMNKTSWQIRKTGQNLQQVLGLEAPHISHRNQGTTQLQRQNWHLSSFKKIKNVTRWKPVTFSKAVSKWFPSSNSIFTTPNSILSLQDILNPYLMLFSSIWNTSTTSSQKKQTLFCFPLAQMTLFPAMPSIGATFWFFYLQRTPCFHKDMAVWTANN